jgi:hypothetical protein
VEAAAEVTATALAAARRSRCTKREAMNEEHAGGRDHRHCWGLAPVCGLWALLHGRPPYRGGPTWYSMVLVEYQLFLKKNWIRIVYTSCVFN